MLLGLELKKLCQEASQEILLVAPFVKASVLEQLLIAIPTKVSLKCVTRWLPEEILTGVSDLEIWSLIRERPNSSLWLRPDLHAKFYRADERCLVGSANLTSKALGWANQSNFELLVFLSAHEPIIKDFEAELFIGCILVDEDLFIQVSDTVKLLAEKYPHLKAKNTSKKEISSENSTDNNLVEVDAWLPTLRNPEDLYLAYSEQIEKLSTVSKIVALTDLRSLPIISTNLSITAFNSYVGTLLLQKPVIQKVDAFVRTPQRFGAVKNLLASLPCASNPNFDEERAWQTLIRWLLYFLPNRYALSVPNHSEVFYRVAKKS